MGTGPAHGPGMNDTVIQFLAACRAFTANPTEANRRRMEELTAAMRVLERGGPAPPPREPVELALVPRLVLEPDQ